MADAPRVLVVDDDPAVRGRSARWLRRAGFDVEALATPDACIAALDEYAADVICLSLELPGIGGLGALREIRARRRPVPVVVLTANASAERVLHAIELGAADHLVKPIDRARLIDVVERVAAHHRTHLQLAPRRRTRAAEGLGEIVGASPPMQRLFDDVERVAHADVSVLIAGESGTGKELVARAIRDNGARARAPWVTLNCAAIPETLQESEIFGHEKGAFTGAVRRHIGKFEQADGGTMFLDEVAELAPTLQAKLLRALQERTVQRIGGTEDVESDFRLIAATNKDLVREVEEGRFRADLFYRIAVYEISVPPLRQRAGDIPLLVRRFLDQADEGKDRTPAVSDEALQLLEAHSWPGNVRELQNAVCRALVACDHDQILPVHLPPRLLSATGQRNPELRVVGAAEPAAPARTMNEIERTALAEAMARHAGDVTAVVEELGLGRATVYRKLKKYALR